MKMLTYEEFCSKPMSYVYGIRMSNGAQRLFRNDELGIQQEVSTPYDEYWMEWGLGSVAFFLDDDPNEYANVAELYVAWFRKNFGEEEAA